MRLVDRDAHTANLRAARQHGVGDRAGSRFHQAIAAAAKRLGHGLNDEIVGNGVFQLVGSRGVAELELELQINLKGLSNLGLVLHHAVIGVQRQSFEKDRVAHRARLIAAVTARA